MVIKKFLVVLAIAAVIMPADAQVAVRRHMPGASNPLDTMDFSSPPAATILDPYRKIDGQIYKVDGSWVAVAGRVVQVHPKEGLRVEGAIEGQMQPEDFFIVNFPYDAAEGDVFGSPNYVYLVKPAGIYTYSTAAGSTRTIRKYDYGIPCGPPVKTPEEIAREAKENAKRAAAGAAAALKSNQEQCAAGDAYGQLRMAERYRDGDGVETNLIKAKVLFELSANQDNADAAKELAALTNLVSVAVAKK